MASIGLQPDPDQELPVSIEHGATIVDLFIRGEITLEEFVKALPGATCEVIHERQ